MFRALASRIQRNVGVGFESTCIYRLKRTDGPIDVSNDMDVRIGPLSADQLDLLARIGPYDATECAARIERGDRCYGAFVGEDLVHYSWAQRSGVHSIDAAGHAIEIAPHELWIYNCRTADAHRGKRLYPATLHQLLLDHFAEGFEVAWIYTSSTNIASQSGITRVGFVLVDTLRALRIGRFFRALDDYKLAS